MKTTKVSIIVPVYNIENYLGQCLDSLVGQTLEDIEIICVNDGSTDGSKQILEEYAVRDQRIKIINQKNAGLGAARNSGMKYVQGSYMGFVDSDDYVDKTMFEELYNNAQKFNSDMVMCQMKVVNESGKNEDNNPYYQLDSLENKFDDGYFSYEDTKDVIMDLAVNAYNKIYKTAFLKELDASFPEGLIFEDNPFFYHTYLNAERVSLVRKPLYFHRVNREGSIISDADTRFFDIIPIQNLNIEQFKSLPNYDDYKAAVINKKITIILHRYFQVSEQYRQKFFELIKQDFISMNLSDEEFVGITNYNKRNYLYIIESDTRIEFELKKENITQKFLMADLEDLNRNIKKNNRKIHKDNEKLQRENKSLKNRNENLKREHEKLVDYLTFKGYVNYKTRNIISRMKKSKKSG